MSVRSPWTLHQVLGQGSYGKVYRASHSGTTQEVAIKQLCRRRVKAENRERSVHDEIATLAAITERYENGHPNILRLFETFETSSSIFIVTELCAGGDVAELIKRFGGRPMPPLVVRGLTKQLAAGLRVLREQNLVHRDLKPANLLLSHHDPADPSCTLKIADFGFSRTLAVGDLAATLVGSPLYVAPELLAFKKYDEKADLWSVGCIVLEMLSGAHPFRSWRGREATNQVALRGNIMAYFKHHEALAVPAPGYAAPGEAASEHGPLPADTVSVLRALLRPDPADRASFDEFFNHPALLPLPPAAAADGEATGACESSLEREEVQGKEGDSGGAGAAAATEAGGPNPPAAPRQPSDEGDEGFVLVDDEDWEDGSGGSLGDLAATVAMGDGAAAPPAPPAAAAAEPARDGCEADEDAGRRGSEEDAAAAAASRAEGVPLRSSLEAERAAVSSAQAVALDVESRVELDTEVEWSCRDLAGMSCSIMGAHGYVGAAHSADADPVGPLAPLPHVEAGTDDDDDDDDDGDDDEEVVVAAAAAAAAAAVEEEAVDAEDERKGSGVAHAAPAPAAAAATAAATVAKPELEPVIAFLGFSAGDVGLFIRSDGGDAAEVTGDGAVALPSTPPHRSSSFVAFSDSDVPPCFLSAQCAAAAPVGAAFVLGRIVALEPRADGDAATVATIEQLQFSGADEAPMPPPDEALRSTISFRRLGVGRIVLFFHTGVGAQYLAFNQGQSNWYLAEDSVHSATRRARERRGTATADLADDNTDLPAFVYGEVIMLDESVASPERNPYQLPDGVKFSEATVTLMGVAPI